MIAGLAAWLLSRGVAARYAKPLAWTIVAIGAAVVVSAIAGIAIAWIYSRGETAGGAKVTVQAQQQHADRVVEARQDEQTADQVARAIDTKVARAGAKTDAQLQSTIEDIRHAFDVVPLPGPADRAPAAPVDGLRASINAGVDRANRAADAADRIR